MPDAKFSTRISETIQGGLKTSKTLFDLAEKTSPANTDVHKLATEISLLVSTIINLHSTFNSTEGCRYSIGAMAIAQKVLDRCQDTFAELEKVVSGLKFEFLRKEEMISKVKAEFDKNGMRILRGTLEACNITLHLMLFNLSGARNATKRRVSMYNLDIETEQHELIIQSLQSSRQSTITALDHHENGDQSQQTLSYTKSTNKLRKLKPVKPPRKKDETKLLEIRKEKASDFVKSLIRDEQNNALIALEFSPLPRENSGAFEERKFESEEREVRTGVGELQGDGPDDLPDMSERMEYMRGWPRVL